MKKITNLLIRIFFIIIALFFLLGFKNVFGYVQTYNGTTFFMSDDLIELCETQKGIVNYGNNYAIYKKTDGTFRVLFWNSTNVILYLNDNNVLVAKSSDNLDFWINIWSYKDSLGYFYGRDAFKGTFNEYAEVLIENNVCEFYSSVPVYDNENFDNFFFESISADSFTLNIDTPIENLISGEYDELVASCNSRFDIIDFIIKVADEFSGQDISQMPILNRCFAEFSNNSYINQQYITKYLDTTVIRMPLIDILPKDNTFYYIYFYVHDTVTDEYFEMFYEYTTDFSEVGIANIENIINSNPNKDILNGLNNGFVALEEQNKNIFQKIGDIFNLLNPFHENFFGRKLVELIIDGLKGLFIPENEYFSNYFDELNNWFSDRLGFLYYPLDVLFDLFNRFLSLSSDNLVIRIPEIKEPTTDVVLINNQSFDFNTLLENQVLRNLHNIYLILIDAIICFGLVNLLYNKYEEVIAK